MTALTTSGRVRYEESWGGYLVLGFAEADQVLRDPGWSSDVRHNRAIAAQFGGADELPDVLTSMMLFADPPAHTRLRRLVAPAFSARRMAALRDRVGQVVDAALDELAGYDEFDVVHELAYPVTVAVIAELLDVGEDGARLLIDETPRLTTLLEPVPDEARLRDTADAVMACVLYLLPLLDERRRDPGPDFLSALQQDFDGDRLSIEETLATTLLLLLAGHETTANLVANGIELLLGEPETRAWLRRDPEMWGPTLEELLRLVPPVRLVGRVAEHDQLLGGLTVPAGAQVVVSLAEANRDPRRFDRPDVFDPTRSDFGHLAFGAGPHFCLGWGLAKLEAEEVLRRYFERFDDRAVVDAPPRRDSLVFQAWEHLVVDRGPGRR